jgi:kinesin family protein 18/19
VETARKLLTQIMNSCTNATAQAIRPDGGLPVTEFFEPSHKGTPKRRKPVNVMGPSPIKPLPMPSFEEAPHLTGSPIKGSPRRKKMVTVKKGIQFSPVKKKASSPQKTKRGVRWRDDNENGTLADFQRTPDQVGSTPTSSSIEAPPPTFSAPISAPAASEPGSSPIPAPPTTSLDIKPRTSRFAAGFLTKKSDGSPTSSARNGHGSDSDNASPLREIGTNAVRPSALSTVETVLAGSNSVSNGSPSSGSEEDQWAVDRSEARQINSVIKRRSSTNQGTTANRRRSPSATTASSPPNENSMFSAGAARRMVKSNHEGDWKNGVLGPRPAPVMKVTARRPTVTAPNDDRSKESGSLNRAPVRVVSHSSMNSRGSLASNAKSVWR